MTTIAAKLTVGIRSWLWRRSRTARSLWRYRTGRCPWCGEGMLPGGTWCPEWRTDDGHLEPLC
jgi:uncharacterized protein (DUF983 family)